jgi:putative phosphoribosyl transferase
VQAEELIVVNPVGVQTPIVRGPEWWTSVMTFPDRNDAAYALAQALSGWYGQNPLVVAIPRGAVPMASIIARHLDGDLDIVLTRKLHAPWNPELAIGAVDETGWTYLADYDAPWPVSHEYIKREVAAELDTIRSRRARYTPDRGPIEPRDRVVIVVDDGLATGATMIAALHALRARHPRHLVCAVPVASREALDAVRHYADEVVCLEAPEYFVAVGQAYLRFEQIDDEEVIEILRATRKPDTAPMPA